MKRTTNISSGALLCGSLLVFSVLLPTIQQSFMPIVYAQELPSSSDIVNVAGKDDESPEADAGPDQSVTEGRNVTLHGKFKEHHHEILTLSWTQLSGPSVTLDDPTVADPKFLAPLVDDIALLEFQFTVTDDIGQNATDTVLITVLELNFAPVAVDQDVLSDEDIPHEITLVASDPDGDPLTFSISSPPDSGSISTIGGNETTMQVRYTPNINFFGKDSFSFEVSDGTLVDSGHVSITVQNVNDPPIANAGIDQTVSEGEVVFLNGAASSDPDGSHLKFLWEQTGGTPSILLSNPAEANPKFTAPLIAGDSTVIFTLTVVDDDNNETSTDAVNITIIDTGSSISGRALVDFNKNGIIDARDTEQKGVTINLSGAVNKTTTTDNDGFYFFELLPPGIYTVTETVPVGYHRIFPTSGNHTVTITISDPTIDEKNFLNSPNAEPIVDAGVDLKTNENTLVSLNGTVSDDSPGLTLLWSQTSGIAVVLDNPSSEDPTFTAPTVTANSTLVFTLTVTDEDGLTTSDSVGILVINVNQAPVAMAGPDQRHNERTEIVLNGAASDSDGTIVAFTWQQVSGLGVSLSNTTAPSPTFMAPRVDSDKILTFRLTVKDNDNGIATDDVSIIVKNERSSRGGGGGGGGGHVNPGPKDNIPTFPASFFLDNPLAKMILKSTAFLDLNGTSILQVAEGQQVQISTKLQNQQQVPQPYVYIIQVLNAKEVAVEINLYYGTIGAGQSDIIAKSWQSSEAGNYRIKVFVWDSVGDTPQPLADANARRIKIV